MIRVFTVHIKSLTDGKRRCQTSNQGSGKMKNKKITRIIILLIAVLAVIGWALPAAGDGVPTPTVTGPIPQNDEPGDPGHDYIFFTPKEDLAAYGYVEEEFFLEGTAYRYDIPDDGSAASIQDGPYPYKTRIVVRRPVRAKDFNGIVILEWQNVTAGYELDAHWGPSWDHFVKYGYAWVGVSAQRVGVHGYPAYYGMGENGLKDWSDRYASLDVTAGGAVTDDSLCYDIYSQAAQAIRYPADVDPMGGLPVDLVIAVGASQSAGRLSIYHNAIHPLDEVVDGFYLLVGGSGLRKDLDVKVFQYLSETDVAGGPGRRMADSEVFRSWEVTGTGHSSWVSQVYREPLVLRDFGEEVFPPDCDLPPYSRVRSYFVMNAQYDHLVRWIKYGIAPPTAPKIEFLSEDPPVIARNDLGIAFGGIRLPEVEVPVAMNTGINSGSLFCSLYGTYQPFDGALLRDLYRNHGTYVSACNKSINQNLRAGYITNDAAREMRSEAARADVPPR